MNLIKNDPFDLSNDFASTIYHISQNFSGHDQTSWILVNSNITSHQTNVLKLVLQLSVFLVGKSLDRRGIDNTAVLFERISNSIFSNCSFTSRCMGTHQYWLIWFNSFDSFGLERIKCESILFSLQTALVLFALIVLRIIDLMNTALLSPNFFNLNIFQSFFGNLLIFLIWFLKQKRLLGMKMVLMVDLARAFLFQTLRPDSFDRLLKNSKGIFAFHCC